MDYSEGPCFGKQDFEEAHDWLISEYETEGKLLYIAFETEMEQRDMICKEELKEWEKYLSDRFEAEELEDIALVDTDIFSNTYYRANS